MEKRRKLTTEEKQNTIEYVELGKTIKKEDLKKYNKNVVEKVAE